MGTRGTAIPVFYDLNSPFPGPGSVQARRPHKSFGGITFTNWMGNSIYHGFEVRAERRFQRGFALLLAYTLGKAIDIGGEQLGGGDVVYRDVRNIMLERGLAGYDMRQRFVISYVYDIPIGRGRRLGIQNPFLNFIVGSWQIAGITTLRSGQSFTPTMGFSGANTGHARPDRIADGRLGRDQRSIDRWFDKSAFEVPEPYNFGNAGRNILIGPGAVNFDFSAMKRFRVEPLGDNGEVQFRAEFFNF